MSWLKISSLLTKCQSMGKICPSFFVDNTARLHPDVYITFKWRSSTQHDFRQTQSESPHRSRLRACKTWLLNSELFVPNLLDMIIRVSGIRVGLELSIVALHGGDISTFSPSQWSIRFYGPDFSVVSAAGVSWDLLLSLVMRYGLKISWGKSQN